MSVSDENMANRLLGWLYSGRKMKLTYNQAYIHDPTKRDTDYEIMRVEPITASHGLDR